MLKLRILLVSNYLYVLLLIIITIYTLACNYKVSYLKPKNTIAGVITNKVIKDNVLTLTIKNNNNYLVKYYFKNSYQIKKYLLGTKVKIVGDAIIPSSSRNINSFDYRKYLLSIDVKYIFKAKKITIIKNTFNIYRFKQLFINYLEKLPNPIYLKAMILADQSGINSKVTDSYRINGISHLLAISGAQIAMFVVILMLLLKKISNINQFVIITSILLLYGFFTNSPPSINRAIIAYIVVSINKIFDLHITNIKLFIITLFISLILNPFIIYNIGFWYSYIISITLIIYQPFMSKNIIMSAIQLSTIAFLASLPISINSFYQVNILGVIYNLFFVPLVSIIIYPGLLLSCIFPLVGYLITPVINLMELLSAQLANIDWGVIKSGKLNIILMISYYILLLFFITKQRLKYIIVYLIFMFYINNIWLIPTNPIIYFIDVGQGDSIFIQKFNINILIDTGGKLTFNNEPNHHQAGKTIVSFLNSIGVFKLDYLILTHGDADHIGDAMYLISQMKIKKIIINQGQNNYLEQQVINKYSNKIINSLSIGWFKTINLPVADNENDNSIVSSVKINNEHLLLMGDLGKNAELSLLTKIDKSTMLKISHHGSANSTDPMFIKTLQPKYAFISVGNNNLFNHPSEKVINILNNYHSQIYRTDQNGMIKLNFKKKFSITTQS